MGNLPVSRTETLIPGDDVPANLLNELQDTDVALNRLLSGQSQTLWPANPVLAGDLTVGGQLLAFADFTFTADSTTDLCTATNHPLLTGAGPILTSNSGGGLPGGLTAGVDIFAIKVSANTFKLATSRANALAGVAIDITSNGTGTQTINHQSTTARVSDVTATRNLIVGGSATVNGILNGPLAVAVITPTLASGNNNDFNPTGLSGAIAVMCGAGAAATITGMAGGVNGRIVHLLNVSGFTVSITNNDTNSTASNRFVTPGAATLTLTGSSNHGTTWIYDGSSSLWRLLAKTF